MQVWLKKDIWNDFMILAKLGTFISASALLKYINIRLLV